MILPLLAALLSNSSAAASWTKVNQPAGGPLRGATMLSDGSWVGLDSISHAKKGWRSTDRGAHWSSFGGEDSAYTFIFGNGVVIGYAWDSTYYYRWYDARTDAWVKPRFDRGLMTGDSSTNSYSGYYDRWAEAPGGKYYLEIARSDSILSFRSTDSARTWTTFVDLAQTINPGGIIINSNFAGDLLWLQDTVRRVLRGTTDGKNWLEMPFTSGAVRQNIYDTLSGGGWIAMSEDSTSNISWNCTRDSGKTWESFDATRPGVFGTHIYAMSDGWSYTYASDQDTMIPYVRPQGRSSWISLPTGCTYNGYGLFVDNGVLYTTIADSGLVSLDLGVLGVRERSTGVSASATWRMEGSDLVVSNAASATGWELRDLSGRNLATGKSSGASELRIPTGERKGLLLVRLTGTAPQAFSVMAP